MTGSFSFVRQQTRSLIITTISLVLLAAAQPFVWSLVSSSAEKLHSKRSEEEQYINLQSRVADVGRQLAEQTEELEQLTASFPSAGNVAQVVERIETQAARSGVTAEITNISEGEVIAVKRKADSGIVPLTISIRTSGSAGQLFEYLQALENTPELSTINSWSLDPHRPGAEFPGSHMLIMNVVFYLQQ